MQYVFPQLEGLDADELIVWNKCGVQLTAIGHFFIRNVCAAFDIKLKVDTNSKTLFSKAI
jgi:oxygen-independent coproporphyrinogen-3 oxidase